MNIKDNCYLKQGRSVSVVWGFPKIKTDTFTDEADQASVNESIIASVKRKSRVNHGLQSTQYADARKYNYSSLEFNSTSNSVYRETCKEKDWRRNSIGGNTTNFKTQPTLQKLETD